MPLQYSGRVVPPQPQAFPPRGLTGERCVTENVAAAVLAAARRADGAWRNGRPLHHTRVLLALCSSLLQKSIKGGLAIAGGLNSGGSIETIFNPVAVETAIEKGAASILMPISGRRQLNDLPEDLAAKITIHYYLDARDALLKALAL